MLHEGPRRATKTTAPHSTTSGARMLLQYRDLGVTTAWEEDPPGSAGVPPAQYLAQPRPSPRPGSTGKGAMPLLRPGPCGSRRQGGRLPHRKETERQPKGQHAGGTPALPGGSSRWCGGGYPGGDFSESRPAPFGKLPFARGPGPVTLPRGGSNEGETGFVSDKSSPRPAARII